MWRYWYWKIYLRSPYWTQFKARVRERYKRCKVATCSERYLLDVHLLTYERCGKPKWYHFLPVVGKWLVRGHEKLSDVVLVCRKHNRKMHERKTA